MTLSIRTRASVLLDRIYPLVAVPGDTAEDRIAKSVTLVVGVAGIVITCASALGSELTATPTPVSISLWLYAALIAVTIGGFVLTKRGLEVAMVFVLAGNIFVAWFGTWYQGGIVQSGANVLWGIVSPVLAMLIFGRRAAIVWFAIYFVVLMAGIFVERDNPPPTTEAAIQASFVVVLVGVSLFFLVLFLYFTRERELAQAEADQERARSDALLLNVLPDEIVARLKNGERVIADRFEDASVLFADIADFTPMSATMTPGELVQLLNEIFSEFDRLAGRYGVEKIKTIGDCYMVAAGVPVPRPDHARVLADMALEMQELVATRTYNGRDLRFRIGINSGPLVAGVIGEQKFIYDLWGDTVNTASRMESHGMAGLIQVTADTRDRLDGAYVLTPRGTVDVKGKGPMPVFLLEAHA